MQRFLRYFQNSYAHELGPALSIIANNFAGFKLVDKPAAREFHRLAHSLLTRADINFPDASMPVRIIFFESESKRSELFFINEEIYLCVDIRQIQMIGSFIKATFQEEIYYLHDLYLIYHSILRQWRTSWMHQEISCDTKGTYETEYSVEAIYQLLRQHDIRDRGVFHLCFEQSKMTDDIIFSLVFAYIFGHEFGHAIHGIVSDEGDEKLSVVKRTGFYVRQEAEMRLKFSGDRTVGCLFMDGEPEKQMKTRERIKGFLKATQDGKLDEEIFSDLIGVNFLGLAAKDAGFGDVAIANMIYAFPSLIVNWAIDLNIVQFLDKESFSETNWDRFLAMRARKMRVKTYYGGAHGFILGYLLLEVIDGDMAGRMESYGSRSAEQVLAAAEQPDERWRRIMALGRDYVDPGWVRAFSAAPYLWGLVMGQVLTDPGNPFGVRFSEQWHHR